MADRLPPKEIVKLNRRRIANLEERARRAPGWLRNGQRYELERLRDYTDEVEAEVTRR